MIGKIVSKTLIMSSLALLLLLTAFILPCTPAQAADGDPECWGVFIGIPYLQNFDSEWWNVDDDAKEFSQALSPVWGSSHIKVLTGSQATKSAILSAISWLSYNVDNDDTVLFFFSGYGDTYLWAYDSLTLSWANDISAAELSVAFESVQAKKVVFIFGFWESDTLQDEISGNGRVIIFAARSGDSVWFDTSYRHIFDSYLVEAFDNYDDVDVNHDYEFSTEELFRYAAPLTTGAHANQHPVIDDRYSGEIPLLVKFSFTTTLPASGGTLVTLDGVNYTTSIAPRLWVPGGSHTITVPEVVSAGEDKRYVFTGWNDSVTTPTRTVSHGSFRANYKTEYLLTITSPYGISVGAGWYLSGSTASFSITNYIETSNTKRYFTGWSGAFIGTSATGSVVMNGPKSLIAGWRTEFLLTIDSEYGTPTGAGWYDAGESVNISVEPIIGFIIRHICDGWSGDLTSTNASTSVTMNGPKIITANWHTDYLQLYILITIVVVLVGSITTTVVLLVRRKNAAPPVTPSAATPTPPPPPKSKTSPKAPPPYITRKQK